MFFSWSITTDVSCYCLPLLVATVTLHVRVAVTSLQMIVCSEATLILSQTKSVVLLLLCLGIRSC